MQDLGGSRRHGGPLEGMTSAEHFVEDDAQGEDVGAQVGKISHQDFRRHVGGRA